MDALLLLKLLSSPVVAQLLIPELSSLFSLLLLVAILNGLLLYWLNRWLLPTFKLNRQVQVLCEYIIQWGLIYITVYQVIFDNLVTTLKESGLGSSLPTLELTNPEDLIVLILPSLISVWIGLILYRVQQKTL